MKTQIIITILAIFVYLSANAEPTISISKKNTNDPTNVCNNSIYYYVTTITDAPSSYTVTWIKTNAEIPEQSTSEAKVKWQATSAADGYTGTIKAQLKSGNTVLATSNTITVTIKSILHLTPEMTPYLPGGGELTLSPCEAGQLFLEVPRLKVPGTGNMNLEKVYTYLWTIPKGWTMNGQTSNGSTEIPGEYYVTVYYPASAEEGTIKVRGFHTVLGCSAEMQYSKSSDAITVKRDAKIELIASKDYFLCGDTTSITYTATSTPEVPCAVYHWNNSPDATTSNTFRKTPGFSDEIVTVKVVYGGKEVVKSKIVEVKIFDGNPPAIIGPSTVCTSGAAFSLKNLPPVNSIVWNHGRFLNVYSGQNTNSPVIKATGNGRSWVQAKLVTDCGSITLPRKSVWAGTRPPLVLLCSVNNHYPGSVGPAVDFGFAGEDYWLYAQGTDLSDNDMDYLWRFYSSDPYHLPVQGRGRQVAFSQNSPGEYTVSLQYNGTCGWSREVYKTIRIDYNMKSNLFVSFSPNPTSGETTLTIESTSKEEPVDETAQWNLEVYNASQLLKEKLTGLRGQSTKIQTAGWKEGVYLVRVMYKGELLTGKLVVKR